MTRLQELAAWGLAVLLAYPQIQTARSNHYGLLDAYSAEDLARVLVTFAPLVIYALRDRTTPTPPRLSVALAIALFVALPSLLPLVVASE
jgi:hypothetical protein